MAARIVFITGTDTGVGKTVATGLLLAHLRGRGVSALAMKPFCSGGREDAEILWELSDREIPLNDLNPFYFTRPVTPSLAAGKRKIAKSDILRRIEKFRRFQVLLIEGAGGLLSPLGHGFDALDLIQDLDCEVLLVGQNRLGVINHSLLSLRALGKRARKTSVLLMSSARPDVSSPHNLAIIRKLGRPGFLCEMPYLGKMGIRVANWRRKAANCRPVLQRLERFFKTG